jgi:hypothetical protein
MGPRLVGGALAAFFFLGGIAFMIPEATREIGIGQIWVVVGLVLGLVFIAPSFLRSKLSSLFQKTQR